MARTDHISEALVRWMDKAFNDADNPPVAGTSGGCQLRPGMMLPAMDLFDDECSLAWILAGDRGNTQTFPTLAPSVDCRQARLVAEFSVGIARCSVALEENGQLPSIETMEAEYARQEDDKDRLWAVTCKAAQELKAKHHATNVSLGPIQVYGPEGGTVAVWRELTIELS